MPLLCCLSAKRVLVISTEQDTHLDTLSSSIQRQREISMHIGSELDVHQGLLEDLEVGIDRTASNLGGARRRLDRVARGARENGSLIPSELASFFYRN